MIQSIEGGGITRWFRGKERVNVCKFVKEGIGDPPGNMEMEMRDCGSWIGRDCGRAGSLVLYGGTK